MATKLSLILLLMVAQTFLVNGGLFDIGCGIVVSTFDIQKCTEEFEESIQPYLDPQTQKVLKLAVCCQVNIFVSCVTEKVESVCGSGAGDTAKSVYRMGFQGVGYLLGSDNDEMSCLDQWQYKPASPLCWPIAGQLGAGLLLVILFLAGCCSCCCSRRNKSNSGTTTTVRMVPVPIGALPQYHHQPAGRGQVPYHQLNKTPV